MKIKKTLFSTVISDLYGRDGYSSHIEVGKEYWFFFSEDTDIFRESNKHWNKLKITYIRSGCLFYEFTDYPNIKEEFCPVNCFMTSQFILGELDPIKDLKGLLTDINTDIAKMTYCFDDKHTIIKNWPNEKEIEVDENKLYEKFKGTTDWILLKAMEIK